jgi:c-di-GMP-binding flagellar brake protein YcgR
MEERRRFPRRAVEGQFAIVPATCRVRVLDISVGGVLLHASRPVGIGVRGALRLTLGGTLFDADIQVWRVTRDVVAAGYRIGASFVSVTPEHRQLIERFAQ